ncbi:MAG: NAD(P)H-hydrate dehydratase [Ruminococcus sp.]|uniref:NAD(P)H-hydrate dehydratase n=1 Tax=Ruminococcus sp. TaxID=41978 RepID=UPI0025F3E77F|nr:NAD(P)H-hydrate dehydratase [Ruminococcus sp.]MCR5599225.1 NAD(P)H-hydrate dehydratase [Ruminococcus sp.]
MQIVTPKQMGRIEERSEKLGVSKRELMENAGKRLSELIEGYCRSEAKLRPEDCSVVFLAGTGNNGGDCFAAADILVYKGYNITIIHIGGLPRTPLAQEMLSRLPRERITFIEGFRSGNVEAAIEAAELDYMTIQPRTIDPDEEIHTRNPLDDILNAEKRRMGLIKGAVVGAQVLVDGVFGTGFHGQLDKDTMGIFSIGSGAYRIAVDVPSGGNSSTGTAAAGIFKADETLTFGFIKSGMTQFPLKKFCGRVIVADIGIPKKALSVLEGDRKYFRIDRSFLSAYPPKRESDAHKGNFGEVLVIAGSSSMRGAAAFAALGALRSGAGIVRVASVEKCIDTISTLVPEATYLELECDDYGFMLYDTSTELIGTAMKRATAVVIGCGMGVTPDTIELTKFVTQNAKCPVIIDADGINCIARDIDILTKKQTDVIITPHVGEMARLINCETQVISSNRILAAEKYAEKYDVTVVLKGGGTVIADSHSTAANHTGNAGMSVGGSGDVLAGMIGSAAAQGCGIFDGACAGVYMHGLAGDRAAMKLGMEAMLPRDIISHLPEAFGILKEKKRNMTV